MQYGIKNEIYFVNYLNNKKVSQLSQNMKELLYSIFSNINDDLIIKCWWSNYLEKADIKIKIGSEVKGISIKTGKNCSMHQENFYKFSKYLIKIGIDTDFLNKLYNFIIGKVNGVRVDSKTYIINNKADINVIREEFNKYYIKINLIMRFIIQGTENQNYDCDAIIYGTPSNFLWATKDEVLKYLVEYKIINYDYINISALNLKCYDRNLRNTKSRKVKQEDIQIKWYTIERDLLNITKDRKKNNIFIKSQ